jgi:hypothetical protein
MDMTTDWRGKPLAVGDTVVFTRGNTRRSFAAGQIIDFTNTHPSKTYSSQPNPGVLVQVTEDTRHWTGGNQKPSHVLLRHVTKVEA